MARLGVETCLFADKLSWHKNYLKLLAKREKETGEEGVSEPEFRLPPAIAGAPLVTIGMFWFGWTTYVSTLWMLFRANETRALLTESSGTPPCTGSYPSLEVPFLEQGKPQAAP